MTRNREKATIFFKKALIYLERSLYMNRKEEVIEMSCNETKAVESEIDFNKIKQIVTMAGEIVITESGHARVFTKGRADFVTQTDLNVQNFIKNSLQEYYPQIGFIGEEEDINIEVENDQWILDPIDGTTNYMYGYHHSAISLALRHKDQIILGIVYNPFTRELFYAEKTKGAFLNDIPIHVNNTEKLEDALVAFGTSPYHKELSALIFRQAEQIFQTALDMRRTGSAALDLVYVACGRQDAYFEYKLKPWDYAAGLLILQEAGGVFVGIKEPISYKKSSDILACTNSVLLKKIKNIVY